MGQESIAVMEKQLTPCRKWKSAMSSLVDGTLTPKATEAARRHAADCPACAHLLSEFEADRAALRSIAGPRLSPDFDQRLALRLSELSQNDRRRYRWSEAANAFLSALARQRQFVALGAAAAVVGVLCTLPTRQSVKPAHREDAALLTQCLAQHRSYASTQPLSDWSAQNLVTSTDPSAIPAGFATGDADTD